uniref:Putative secreted protein n=1 Tax=Anopheles darlingi TaxID=43151 RepID=A0A2M4D0S0_ANODA
MSKCLLASFDFVLAPTHGDPRQLLTWTLTPHPNSYRDRDESPGRARPDDDHLPIVSRNGTHEGEASIDHLHPCLRLPAVDLLLALPLPAVLLQFLP